MLQHCILVVLQIDIGFEVYLCPTVLLLLRDLYILVFLELGFNVVIHFGEFAYQLLRVLLLFILNVVALA